ncbi:MAG: hypothetical protein Q4E91_01650 [Lachnospiraceae bacterium]|nr:hypothetical protein [Lachnospiraceae bacterium]
MSGEWKTILGIGGIIAVMILAYAVYIIYNNRKTRRRRLRMIREDWGAWPARQYDYLDWNAVEGYYGNKETKRFQIDDITWNDLDMDRIFMLLNHTGSFMGEGYLYYLLRTPSFYGEELAERERLIQYFTEHPKEREQLQMFFYQTGKAGRSSIFDAVYNLADVNPVSNLHHYFMAGIFLASICTVFLSPQIGILLVIGAMCLTMWDYYRKKRPVEQYIISCRFLLRTLKTAEEMGKIKLPEISAYQEKIREAGKVFGKLKRNTFFLINGSRTDGDLLVGLIMYLNNCFHIDLIQFSTIVKEMKLHIKEFETLIEEMGKIESAIAIASFRQCMQDFCVPALDFDGAARPALEAENLYHPLIQEPVKNSIKAGRGVLLTGSNASGKSTFLKTVAVNAVLAQTVHTCMADQWTGSSFRVFSSMALQDNLEGQESYYIVEIKSLKRILDQIASSDSDEITGTDRPDKAEEGFAGKKPPVLCFVDEVLRGTNTVERIAASSQILKYMTGKQVLCFAATHDIELTHILEDYYENYHFQEEVLDGDIRFDYKLYSGRATSRNAIKLLQIMGYDEKVIARAETAAEQFLKDGEWAKE